MSGNAPSNSVPPKTGQDQQRVELIRRQLKGWCDSLINLDGRNPLLRYSDLKVGTLSLPSDDSKFVQKLAYGANVRVDDLVAEQLELNPTATPVDYNKKVLTIYKKAKENSEERGVSTARLVAGIVHGETVDGKPIRAPLLVQTIAISPTDSSH